MISDSDKKLIARQLVLSDANMDESVDNQAGWVYYWGEKLVDARQQADMKKVAMDEMEAKVSDELRTRLSAGGDKVTDKMVKEATTLDKRYHAAQEEYFRAKALAEFYDKAVCSAFDNKRSMLKIKHERILARLNPEIGSRILSDRVDGMQRKGMEVEAAKDQLRESRKIKLKK